MSDLHVNGPVLLADPVISEGIIDSKPGTIFNATLLAIGTYNTQEIYNPNAKGVRVWAFASAGAGSFTAAVQVKDPVTGTWAVIPGAITAAISASAGGFFTVYPGLTGIADAAGDRINNHLGPQWRIQIVVSTNTLSLTVGAQYLL